MKTNYLVLILAWLFLFGCRKDVEKPQLSKPPGCDSAGFSYEIEIRPLIIANCSGLSCHSGGNSNNNFLEYEELSDRIRNGRLEERLLLPESDPMHMPFKRKMESCDVFVLRTWIHQGYKQN